MYDRGGGGGGVGQGLPIFRQPSGGSFAAAGGVGAAQGGAFMGGGGGYGGGGGGGGGYPPQQLPQLAAGAAVGGGPPAFLTPPPPVTPLRTDLPPLSPRAGGGAGQQLPALSPRSGQPQQQMPLSPRSGQVAIPVATGPRTVHELLSQSEQLKQYIPAFIEAGVDDLPFLLGETRAQWDAALDTVRDVGRTLGIELRVGHRMQIISLLQREQARLEEANRPLTASLQPPLTRDPTGASPNRRANNLPARQDQLQRDPQAEAAQSGTGVLTHGCNRVCGKQMHWLCCFIFALALLLFSLLLWYTYDKLKDDDLNGAEADDSGGWQFVRVLAIFGFTATSVLFCCCGWIYCRNPASRGVECPAACAGGCPSLSCGDCKLPAFDCCSGGAPAGECCPSGGASSFSCPSCSCPGCDAPSCSLPSCECDVPRPSCNCDCLPDCSGVGDCCATVYKIVCCQCKIQVG